MRRKVLLILIIFTLISMLIVIYAKANFRHVDNYFFYENSLYSFLASENDLIDEFYLTKILKGGFNPTVFFPYKLFLDKFELISSFKLSPFAIVERYRRKS